MSCNQKQQQKPLVTKAKKKLIIKNLPFDRWYCGTIYVGCGGSVGKTVAECGNEGLVVNWFVDSLPEVIIWWCEMGFCVFEGET